MEKKLLGLAALLIGLSMVFPWATMSGNVSYSTFLGSISVSSSGWIFVCLTVVRNTRIESGLWGNPVKTEDTVIDSFPFQAIVFLFWLIGLVLILVGIKDRRIALMGGVISLVSLGYFLYELPNLSKSGFIASWPGVATINIRTEPSLGCMLMVMGSLIAMGIGIYGLVKERKNSVRATLKELSQN